MKKIYVSISYHLYGPLVLKATFSSMIPHVLTAKFYNFPPLQRASQKRSQFYALIITYNEMRNGSVLIIDAKFTCQAFKHALRQNTGLRIVYLHFRQTQDALPKSCGVILAKTYV